MRLSISAKIFVGFLVVLATFGAVAAYGAVTMRHLGDELRLVSRGYLDLRLQLSEALHSADQPVERAGAAVKEGHAARPARQTRSRCRAPRAPHEDAAHARVGPRARGAAQSAEEHALLNLLRGRLLRVQSEFQASTRSCSTSRSGPSATLALERRSARLRGSRDDCGQKEEAIRRQLSKLSARAQAALGAGLAAARDEEDRAVWAALLLVVIAVAVGVAVMGVATATLRRSRGSPSAPSEIARGDYKQRVDASSPDEIGALAAEFNAMAAALDEREQRLIRSERLAAVGKIAAQITHEVRNPLVVDRAQRRDARGGGARCPKIARPRRGAGARHRQRGRSADRDHRGVSAFRAAAAAASSSGRTWARSRRRWWRSCVPSSRRAASSSRRASTPSLPSVAADELQLRQALLNLMRNAAEAMAGGGQASP